MNAIIGYILEQTASFVPCEAHRRWLAAVAPLPVVWATRMCLPKMD
jgi:hypothetical protein